MTRMLNVVAALTLCAATRAAAQAQAADQGQSAPASEWSSTSGAKTAAPLPSASPLADDLGTRAAPPRAADVPLPPPPKGTALVPAQQGAPAPATYTAPGGMKAAAVQGEYSAPGAPDGSKEPKTTFAADHTGAMVQVTQDLDSDRIRQDWAGTGGTIPAFEASLGMTMMGKTLNTGGTSTVMTGVGLDGGFRVAFLSLVPPKYETRDTSWNAWRIGAGMDLGALAVTMTSGPYQSRAQMSTMTLVMSLGFMHAFGSFDSPSEWSGFAIGADWAPSWQSTTLTIPAQTIAGFTSPASTQTSSSFNATGFAINFESGSMQSMSAKLGKKARMKVSLFFLPPVGDMPFLMSANIGANWY